MVSYNHKNKGGFKYVAYSCIGIFSICSTYLYLG